jgi:hypothetical protein
MSELFASVGADLSETIDRDVRFRFMEWALSARRRLLRADWAVDALRVLGQLALLLAL